MSLFVSWAALTISMFFASKLLKGMTIEGGVGSHLGVAALYGVLMFLFGFVLQFVLGVASMGILFLLWSSLGRLIAGTILLVVADKLSKKLTIDGFGTAFAAAFITAVFSAGAQWALGLIGLG